MIEVVSVQSRTIRNIDKFHSYYRYSLHTNVPDICNVNMSRILLNAEHVDETRKLSPYIF